MPYAAAYEMQQEFVARCAASEGRENFLMLVEHPPVITVGRSGRAGEVLAGREALAARGVEVVETNRGGRVTFHGPGQLVIYPVIDLKARGRDLHRYLRDLERWLIRLLGSYGIEAGVRPPHTGVWVGERKVASIGIAVRHWVAYHGVALNVTTDLSFFDLIVPCGLPKVRVTSMAELLTREPDVKEVARRATRMFREDFGFGNVECRVRNERRRLRT
jgi:lipoate-protein ligase B